MTPTRKFTRFKNRQMSIDFGEEFQPRHEADREKVVELIKPHSDGLMNAILTADDKYQAFAADNAIARQQHSFAPSNLTALIVQEISKISGFTLNNFSKGTPEIMFDDYKFWVKKIDEKFSPRFNQTKSSQSRANQLTNDDDEKSILILGYQLNDLQRVSGVYLVYLRGEEKIWTPINLGDMAAQIEEEAMPVNTQQEVAEIPMTVKKGKRASQAV